jgi:hypothetical membrane protein
MIKNTKQTQAAKVAIATSVIALLLLAALHILSPEFDPAWRMVSEYANGKYGWMLSLFFWLWGISTWALAYAIWLQVQTRTGKIGLYFLVAAGIGEFMGGLFDINHPLHELAGMIGILGLMIAAMLIGTSLVKNESWISIKKPLLWSANLTWISIVFLVITFAIMITTFVRAGGDMTSTEVPTTLPDGVIALVGWANRFLVIVYNVWVIVTAQHVAKIDNIFIRE